MNHSLYSADQTTHLKILALALVSAIAVSAIGLAVHSTGGGDLAQAEVRVVKPGKAVMVTSSNQLAVR